MSQSKKISLSLLQSRLLYKFNYGHIEPLAIQEGLITQEFPAKSWVVEALKVGYTVFQNASRQPRKEQPEKLASMNPTQRDRVFLSTVLINTVKVIGISRLFDLIFVLLKNFPYVFGVINNVLFIWKGAPPDAEALEEVLVTPLGRDLAEEFREEGSLGIQQAFSNFFGIREDEKRKQIKAALKRSQKQLSPSEIETENQAALEETAMSLEQPVQPHHFESIQQFRDLFVEGIIDPPPIVDTFQDDEIFAYMRLAGPNPVMIEQMTADNNFFHKFPVTDQHFQAVMGEADSLDRAMAEGRLYGVDYDMLEGALLGTFGPKPEAQKYLYPAIALFAVPDASVEDRFLKPIAIQCGQDPQTHPLMTPDSGQYAWLGAKSAIQVADSTIHEAITHLGCTHLLVEPFVVTTHRQLPQEHCVYRLLMPHFQGTILINYGAWKLLTAPEQGVNSLLPPTIAQSRTVAVQGLRQLGFNDQMFPKRLNDRGVMDRDALPLYPYRDDGLLVWNALHDWVDAYLKAHYQNNDEVKNDVALQNWAQELINLEGGRLEQFGNDGDGEIATIEYLADALTMVIFTGSAQHAAVNFPQKGIMSYAPAMPMAGYIPAEKIPSIQSEQDWCRMLPPEDQAKQQLQILQILGGVNYTDLGKYTMEQTKLFGDDVKMALAEFHKRLDEIEHQITARNNELPGKFEYEYLKPSNIPQSINI